MNATWILALGLTTATVACVSFDQYGGPDDAGQTKTKAKDATIIDVLRDSAKGTDTASPPACTGGWKEAARDASCASRTLVPVATAVGPLSILRITRAFGSDVALLYDAHDDVGVTLTLAIVDPSTGSIEHTVPIASAKAFDSAALAYDDQGTLSIVYHRVAGGPVTYVALDGGLSMSPSETVTADAGASLVAVSPIPQPGTDGGTLGPLGFVSGTVGVAWFAAPPEPNDFSLSYVHLFARQGGGWSELETYGYTEVRSDLGLQPNPQRGVVASGVTYSTMTLEPYEACTWQMAGRQGVCGIASHLFGLSLVTTRSAAYLTYTFADPNTGVTTLDFATDTDGTYQFPLLSTVATFPGAAQQGVAEPRAGIVGSTLVMAVSYPIPAVNLPFQIDFATFDMATDVATTEHITTVTSTSAKVPPLDLVVDSNGVPTMAIADPAAGSLFIARALLPGGADAGADAP